MTSQGILGFSILFLHLVVNYNTMSNKNLKINTNKDLINEGRGYEFTLQDRNILEDDLDILENQILNEAKRISKNQKKKELLTEYDKQNQMLSKYDQENEEVFILGLQEEESFEDTKEEKVEELSKIKEKFNLLKQKVKFMFN